MKVTISLRDEIYREIKGRWYSVSWIINKTLGDFFNFNVKDKVVKNKYKDKDNDKDNDKDKVINKNDVVINKDNEFISYDDYMYFISEYSHRIDEVEIQYPYLQKFFLTLNRWQFNRLLDIMKKSEEKMERQWLPYNMKYSTHRESPNDKRNHPNSSFINWVIYQLDDYDIPKDLYNELLSYDPSSLNNINN